MKLHRFIWKYMKLAFEKIQHSCAFAGFYGDAWRYRNWPIHFVPTGKLRVAAYGESFIRDSSTAGGEERIGEILLALYLQSEDVRIEREKREEAKRKAEEERRQKELRRQKYNDEVDKLQALNNAARDYETACRIRAYIAAVESSPELDAETLDWIAWAKAKADWYDPTVAATDPLFGKRNHSEDPNSKTPTKRSSYFY